MPTVLSVLSPAKSHPATETSQRFLASAFDSVEAVLVSLDVVRRERREDGQDLRGRLASNEEDLVRAAIVFAGAGVDATLKQLIRDALPRLLQNHGDAHDQFVDFVKSRLGAEDWTRSLSLLLTSESPRQQLIEQYVQHLTGGSLQSQDEVQRVASALGISTKPLQQRIVTLRELFVARNEISHELDLRKPERHGDRTRRSRAMGSSVELAHRGLEVTQLIVNAVAVALA